MKSAAIIVFLQILSVANTPAIHTPVTLETDDIFVVSNGLVRMGGTSGLQVRFTGTDIQECGSSLAGFIGLHNLLSTESHVA